MHESLPQLWDVVSALDAAPDPVEVDQLAAAEQARVGFAERLRGAVGLPVRAQLLTGTPIRGTLAAVFGDGVVVTEEQGTWVIRPHAIARIDLSARAPVAATGRERGSALSAVREFAGAEVVVATADHVITRMTLAAVGADHLVVLAGAGGTALVPWPAVTWVRGW